MQFLEHEQIPKGARERHSKLPDRQEDQKAPKRRIPERFEQGGEAVLGAGVPHGRLHHAPVEAGADGGKDDRTEEDAPIGAEAAAGEVDHPTGRERDHQRDQEDEALAGPEVGAPLARRNEVGDPAERGDAGETAGDLDEAEGRDQKDEDEPQAVAAQRQERNQEPNQGAGADRTEHGALAAAQPLDEVRADQLHEAAGGRQRDHQRELYVGDAQHLDGEPVQEEIAGQGDGEVEEGRRPDGEADAGRHPG